MFYTTNNDTFCSLKLLLVRQCYKHRVSARITGARVVSDGHNGRGDCAGMALRGPRTSRLIGRMRRFVRRGFGRPVRIDNLTTVMGVAPHALGEHFRSYIAVHPVRCVRTIEVRRTGHLLRSKSIAVGSLTRRINCRSVSSFAHLFGHTARLAPGRCRSGFSQLTVWLCDEFFEDGALLRRACRDGGFVWLKHILVQCGGSAAFR